ncbi:MAG: helicase, partial [Muribaculaceae bacterium]|nr:helicase [Muribaculaceae bacterium]
MAQIYDNIETKFKQGLHDIVANAGVKRVDFCVGYFNLRGWNHIQDEVDEIPGDYVYEQDANGNDIKKFRICRLLIGMHKPDEELIRALYSTKSTLADNDYVQRSLRRIAENFRQQLLLGVPTAKDEETLRRLFRQMKEGKVVVKLYLKHQLHAKLYIAHMPECYNKQVVIMGSSNLTYSGLMGNGELNADFTDSDHVKKMANWFDDRWNDRQCIDITQLLIEIIDESWAGDRNIPPYYIYLKAAYHLSQDARNGIREFTLAPEFQHELFEFQQNAVKIAAKNLNNDKRNGAMIGDVVGLGKTMTACAIAKIFEDTFSATTLIICPANLQDMWHKYINKYNLKAIVHSMSKPIDVDRIRFCKLIIIDESHNLRNSSGKRYQNIRSLIERQDCRVLLLTATPYNKDFSDLSSQLRLFIDDNQDLGIRPENYIQSIGGEYQFAYKHGDIDIRSIRAFDQSDNPDDWNELMKLFLVRRTRSFI